MKQPPRAEGEIRVKRTRGGAWISVEEGGKDVSHLYLGPRRVRVGARGEVRMAGISGVATDPEFRRRGLAGRVFRRAMEEIGHEGYSCLGLFTGIDIVAHRLYRTFGFTDIGRERPGFKLLDPAAFAAAALSRLVVSDKGGGAASQRPWMLRLELHPHRAVHLLLYQREARVVERPRRKPDLTLSMSGGTFAGLCSGSITPQHAEAAKLINWHGQEEVWRRLREGLASRHQVVRGW